MEKEQIAGIVSQYTLNIGKTKTLEDVAMLENRIIDKLYQLFILYDVKPSKKEFKLSFDDWKKTQLADSNCYGGKYKHILGFWVSERSLLENYRKYRNKY